MFILNQLMTAFAWNYMIQLTSLKEFPEFHYQGCYPPFHNFQCCSKVHSGMWMVLIPNHSDKPAKLTKDLRWSTRNLYQLKTENHQELTRFSVVLLALIFDASFRDAKVGNRNYYFLVLKEPEEGGFKEKLLRNYH